MTEWWSGDNIGNLRKGFIMRIGKIAVAVIGLFPFNVYGECTPTPDCDAIGYTETSCETISLKCPFDQSKLYCFPCDSSYQYSCSEPNEYGNGESCGNKYKSCCDTSCVVGSFYYSDGTCDTCLSAIKRPVGIVVKDQSLVMSPLVEIPWATDYVNISGLPDVVDLDSARTDLSGKENTAAIVAYYGSGVSNVAGVYCYNYAPQGMEETKGSWYLPAAGEIYYYGYLNYDKILTIDDAMTK